MNGLWRAGTNPCTGNCMAYADDLPRNVCPELEHGRLSRQTGFSASPSTGKSRAELPDGVTVRCDCGEGVEEARSLWPSDESLLLVKPQVAH